MSESQIKNLSPSRVAQTHGIRINVPSEKSISNWIEFTALSESPIFIDFLTHIFSDLFRFPSICFNFVRSTFHWVSETFQQWQRRPNDQEILKADGNVCKTEAWSRVIIVFNI